MSHTKTKTREQRVLLLANSEGLVDLGYTGELMLQLFNPTSEPCMVKRGEALVQVAAANLQPAEFWVIGPGSQWHAEMFGSTERGEGGFGSTGAQGSAVAPPPAQ